MVWAFVGRPRHGQGRGIFELWTCPRRWPAKSSAAERPGHTEQITSEGLGRAVTSARGFDPIVNDRSANFRPLFGHSRPPRRLSNRRGSGGGGHAPAPRAHGRAQSAEADQHKGPGGGFGFGHARDLHRHFIGAVDVRRGAAVVIVILAGDHRRTGKHRRIDGIAPDRVAGAAVVKSGDIEGMGGERIGEGRRSCLWARQPGRG